VREQRGYDPDMPSSQALSGSAANMSEVTHILEAIQQGDAKAAEELLPLVYGELRKLAAHKMANELPKIHFRESL